MKKLTTSEMRSVVGGKTYVCYVCGKKFKLKFKHGWHLIAHGVKGQL